MNRRRIGCHRKLKRGSYWSKHRAGVSRWLDNIVKQLRTKRRKKPPMFETVEEAMKHYARKK
jgi:hypothetical protein